MKHQKLTAAVAALLLVTVIAAPTAAQNRGSAEKTTEAPRKRGTVKPDELKVFSLQYADASELMDEVRVLIGPSIRLAVDVRTNRLIASGTPDELQVLEAILMKLDEPSDRVGQTDESLTEAIRVRRGTASRTLRDMLALTLAGHDANFVVDESREIVIVRGHKKEVERVKELIELLERAAPPQVQAPSLKLRVIWLTTEKGEKAAPVPVDLAPVVKSLEKIGIKDLGLATQMLVNVGEPNEEFSIQGMADKDAIHVEGVRQGETVIPARLQLTISVDRRIAPDPNARRGVGSESVAHLQAAVTLAPRQMVVLGASPSQRGNSVFVVQLIEGL